jgi:rhomboid family GlyGly-CTERM serine protease
MEAVPVPARAWLALCGVLALGSLAAWWLPAAWLDWQPALAWGQPWRWVTAAWVHWSTQHLAANLAGLVVLAGLGVAARLPPVAALAAALAWPLTHLGLLAQPGLAHYGGASGVLHAAVAVAACWLVVCGRGRARAVGGAIAVGLLLKVVSERPWGGPLARPQGWDIALAPLAHASGAVAGAACALLCALVAKHARRRAATAGPAPEG